MLLKSGKNGISNILRKISNKEKNWSNGINKVNNNKEKVIILGSGWGGIHFLLNIDFKKYDVTLISPRSYFTFTPLLPCVCSGTLGINVCTESVRSFLKKNNSIGNYLQLECTNIIYKDNYIKCKDSDNNEIKINYDYLIIAIGAKTNSFNIKGVDKYAFFVKEVEDAVKIRRKFIENLEKCSLPNTSDEQKKKLLHVVVVGGGPTGVEVAAEFADFINREVKMNFENIFNFISISIVEGGKNLLPTFTQNISDFTKRNFRDLNVNVLTNYYVTEVEENNFYIQSSIDKTEKKKMNYGILIWASGLAQTPLANSLMKEIPKQANNKVLTVDSQLRIIGIESNNVYAIGDCKKITPLQMHEYTSEIIDSLNCSKLTSDVLKSKSEELSELFPQISKLKWDFEKNKKGEMNEQQFQEYLHQIDKNYKSPAPTAQNAKQEAQYLSNIFNQFLTRDNKLYVPAFRENWKGSLAYIGNHQVVAHLPFYEVLGGPFSFTFWKAVYIQLLITWKSRFSFLFDFLRTKFHGRSFIK